MEFDNSFWATVAFFVFVGGLIYIKIPKTIAGALDSKIDKIQNDLDEAKRLREEAQALLAKYELKRTEAESEAQDIVDAAQEEANRIAEEAKISLEEMIERRTKAVELKISQAETQAVNEVRERSADVAVEAARAMLVDQMSGKGDALVDAAINDVGSKLN